MVHGFWSVTVGQYVTMNAADWRKFVNNKNIYINASRTRILDKDIIP